MGTGKAKSEIMAGVRETRPVAGALAVANGDSLHITREGWVMEGNRWVYIPRGTTPQTHQSRQAGGNSHACSLTVQPLEWEMVKRGEGPDKVGVVRPGEEADASLLHPAGSAEGDEDGGPPAPSTRGTANVSVPISQLQLRQSVCYIGAFIAAGLMVGTCGPALPTLFKRINGNAAQAAATDEDRGVEVSLASAFALRAFGGLGGSIAQGWLLMSVLPRGGHMILAGGLVAGATAPVILCYASQASHLALAFILLDFGCGFANAANTMMVWVQPYQTTQWLNILNGSFGIGTLVSPALVAFLDLLLGSTSEAVEMALLIVPLAVLLVAVFCIYVPSPTAPEGTEQEQGKQSPGADEEEGGKTRKIESGSWQWAAAVALTVSGLNCAVGAETTFGTFLVAYVETQREQGNLRTAQVIFLFWLDSTWKGYLGTAEALCLLLILCYYFACY